MKKRLSFLVLICGILIFAQEKLKVTYEGTMTLDETNSTNKKIDRNFVPTTFELIIDGSLSEFKYIEKLENQPQELGVVTAMSSDNYFIDLKENKYFVKQKIFNKNYLVSDSIQKPDWKIHSDTKEIESFSVRKASVITAEGDELVAYYTPKIPYKIGPELYGGLPGLILILDISFDTMEKTIVNYHYKAIKVEVINDDYKVKLPRGKVISFEESERISNEQFNKIVEMNKGGVDKD